MGESHSDPLLNFAFSTCDLNCLSASFLISKMATKLLLQDYFENRDSEFTKSQHVLTVCQALGYSKE